MAQASVTGPGGVQIALSVHGTHLDPINIGPAKDLWHQLGEALALAESNRATLIAEGTPTENLPEAPPVADEAPDSAPRPKDPGLPEGVATVADVPTIDETKVKPEDVVVGREDLTQEPTPEAEEVAATTGIADPAEAPEAAAEGAGTDFSQMTKPELRAFLDASGVEHKSADSKDELVAKAEAV